MNAIIIHTDRIEVLELSEQSDSERLAQMQAAVGGLIQLVPVEVERVSCFVNEEGKFDPDCEPNPLALEIFHTMGGRLFPGDFIAGPMLVTGFDPQTGETTALDGRIVAGLASLAKFLTTSGR